MRILYVGRNAKIGGGSTFRYNVGRGMRDRGHEVTIAALGGQMADRYRKAGLSFRWSPPHPLCGGWLARIARNCGAELIHASNTTAGDVALAASHAAGIPLVVSLHNTISRKESQHRCLKEARRVLVFDSGAAESAGRFGQEFDTGKIVQLPRPVEHQPLAPEALSPLEIAYVSRLSSRKGKVALSLLEGFAAFARQHPGARLQIIGDGSMFREVSEAGRTVTAETGAEVVMAGVVTEPKSLLTRTGILIGAGYAALEALMQGRAVVGAGFKGYGPIHADNVAHSATANFGDTAGSWEMSAANFHAVLEEIAAAWDDPTQRNRYWYLDRVLAPIHSIPAVVTRLEEVYTDVLRERA